MRFGKSIRYFCSILFTVGMIIYLPVAIYVPALTFSQVSGLGVHTITPIVCLVCTWYTCVGGLKAVVWTDAVQSFVMYGTILTICVKGTFDLGGLGVVLERNLEGGRLRLPDLTWDPTVRLSMVAMILGGTLHKIQSNDVNQMSLQRFMSLPDLGKVKKCMILFTVLLVILLFGCCYMGLLTYATYHDCDPLTTKLAQADDQLPTILVMRILGSIPGLPGLFVAGVFSAALSSLSTGLNSMACVISEDLVKPFVTLTEKQNGFLLRFIVAFFGLGCIALVFIVEKMGTVLQFATMTGAVTMGPILGFYTAGVCMPWIKEKSVLMGGIVSFLIMSWICINAQIGQMTGEIRHPKLPISIEGCSYDYDNATYWEKQNYTPSERNIYHLSFMWYTGCGGIICCLVANIFCWVFGFTKPEDINPDLISPVLRKYLPQVVVKNTIIMNDLNLKEKEPLYKFDIQSDSVYLELRFDRRLRLFGSVMFLVGMMLWLPISIYIPALTFNQVTGINLYNIIPVVCIVCTIYTCIGGIKGVIWTDVLQGFIMIGSLLFVAIKGTIDVGGMGEVYQRNLDSGRIEAPEFTFDPTVRMGFFAVFVGGTLLKLQGNCINQPAVQRYLSLPSLKECKKALYIFMIGLFCLLSLCVYLGLLAYAHYYDCDPISTRLAKAKDQIIPLYVMQIAGSFPGIPGLFVSGVFSAALSSLSTALNSLSGVMLKDFIEPFRTKPLTERQTAFILRGVVLVFGFSSMFLVKVVEKLGLVMQLSATVNSISLGPLLGIFTVGMTMPFVKSESVLTGCISAALTMTYVAIRSQIDSATGVLTSPIKPVSIEGCTYEFESFNRTILSTPLPSNSGAAFHHLSFMYYTALGAVITIIVTLLATLYFGKQDSSEMDPKLIVPKLRKYMNKQKYTSVPWNMEKISEKVENSEEYERRDEKEILRNEKEELEYFEKRFSRRMRFFGATLFNLKTVLWLPIAVYVPALTFSQVSGIDIHTITPVVIVICTFYTCVGGIKGVVWTDVIQSFIMFTSMIVLIIKGTIDIGGFQVLWQRNMEGGRLNYPEVTVDPTVRMSVLSVFVGGTFFKLQNTSINQPTVQRFMSLPNIQKIKQTIYTFSIGLTLLYLLCIYVGLLAYATYYDCDPMSTGLAHARDQLIPVLVMDVLGKFPGMPGLFVAGVFSAALSSLSTYLNSLAAVVLEDFVKPNIKVGLSERNTAIIMRTVVIGFGLSSMCLVYVVEKLGMVLQLSATLQSILYGPMLGIFSVGMLMPWINEKSILTGSIISFLSMAWICINAQIAIVTGSFRHTKLPVSIEGCEYEFDMTRYLNSTSEYLPTQGTAIYHISFLWYTTLGACLVIVGSNVASLVFGLNDVTKVDEKLLAPFVANFLKKYKYSEVELQENIELSNENDKL